MTTTSSRRHKAHKIAKNCGKSHLLSSSRPMGIRGRLVRPGNSGVSGSSPKPAVDVNGLQMLGVTALALEVALAARGVDGAHVVCKKVGNL